MIFNTWNKSSISLKYLGIKILHPYLYALIYNLENNCLFLVLHKYVNFSPARDRRSPLSCSLRGLVLSSFLDSNGIPGSRARSILNIAREIDPRRKGNRAYSSVSSARGAKMSPSDASYCLKKKKKGTRGCARIYERVREGRESDGLEGIEGRISSKAAANTEVLLPFPRPRAIVLVYTILQRRWAFRKCSRSRRWRMDGERIIWNRRMLVDSAWDWGIFSRPFALRQPEDFRPFGQPDSKFVLSRVLSLRIPVEGWRSASAGL